MLMWDYDGIWGAFYLGYYKGILMVDHGPEREPPEFSEEFDEAADDEGGDDDEPDPIYFDFTWRQRCSEIPNTAVNNPLVTRGKMRSPNVTRGYFEGMSGVGLPNGRCDLHGNPVFGPRRVPRSLQSFIDDWNELNFIDEGETMRQVPSSGSGVSSQQPGQT